MRQPEPKGLEAIAQLVRPLLTPLATSALVVLFLVFILLQREDLRDRFLRLAGTADLQRTTAALDDAASRLSRFFLAQTLLNTGFGIVIAGGLWVIGVPNAVLWGILAGLMRFVPFIGGFIAAFFPIALAAAVDPGWSMVLATAALFLIAEPLAGHIVEPLLYGQHTGLSPVAIVVAALFWTLLWGPIGLLLATPLTVCLVVLGKHIEALEFIAVALGDEPALKPEEQFYQRLLAGNAIEAAAEAEDQLKEQSLLEFYEAVPMRALGLAQVDAASGKLSLEKQAQLRDGIADVVEDLAEEAQAFASGEASLAVLSQTALPPAMARAAPGRLHWNPQPPRPGGGHHAWTASHEPRTSSPCRAVLRRAVGRGQRRGPRCSARVPFVFRGGYSARPRAHHCAPGKATDAARTNSCLLLDARRRSRQAGSMAQGRRSRPRRRVVAIGGRANPRCRQCRFPDAGSFMR